MSRLFLAILTALLLSAAARAEDARPCAHERDRAMTILQRSGSRDALDQIMVDLMNVRLRALNEAEADLREMPPEPTNGFFAPWSFKSKEQLHAEWELARTEKTVRVDTACAQLQARLEDYASLKR